MSDYDKARKDLNLQSRYHHLMQKKEKARLHWNRQRIAYENAAHAYREVCKELNEVVDELNETFKSEGMVL